MNDFMIKKFGSGEKELRLYLLPSPIEKNAVGMVDCNLFSARIALAVDPRLEDERNYDYACLSYVKGSDVGTIYIEDRVYQGLKDNGNMERMILLHELGHFFYHHQVNKATSTSQIDQVRLDAISNGKIYEDEKQADEFAAGYIGFLAAADGLEQLKQESAAKYENGEYDPDEVALSIKELELRIQHLRHLESSGQANQKSGR